MKLTEENYVEIAEQVIKNFMREKSERSANRNRNDL